MLWFPPFAAISEGKKSSEAFTWGKALGQGSYWNWACTQLCLVLKQFIIRVMSSSSGFTLHVCIIPFSSTQVEEPPGWQFLSGWSSKRIMAQKHWEPHLWWWQGKKMISVHPLFSRAPVSISARNQQHTQSNILQKSNEMQQSSSTDIALPIWTHANFTWS